MRMKYCETLSSRPTNAADADDRRPKTWRRLFLEGYFLFSSRSPPGASLDDTGGPRGREHSTGSSVCLTVCWRRCLSWGSAIVFISGRDLRRLICLTFDCYCLVGGCGFKMCGNEQRWREMDRSLMKEQFPPLDNFEKAIFVFLCRTFLRG